MSKPSSRTSKPNSPKQKPLSRNSTSADKPSASGTTAPSSNKQSTSQKQSGSKADHALDEYTRDCPAGLYKIFIGGTTQAAFSIRSEEDITQEDNVKKIARQQVLDDIYRKQVASDFHPLRKLIEDYADEEILVVYDYEFHHDKNYYLCLNNDLKNIINNPPITLPPEPFKEPPKYVPPTPKPWAPLGSDKEIILDPMSDRRGLLNFSVQVQYESLMREANFSDMESDEKKHMSMSILPYEDAAFETKRVEIDKAIQAIPRFADSSAQTVWRYPKNVNTQYEARTMSEEEQNKIIASDEFNEFVKHVLPNIESVLQQNTIFDSFENDWLLLGTEMSSIGGPGDIHLKEYQSFSDIHNSKNKIVTCVQWHPTLKGIVAMSLADNYSLYDRIDNASKAVVTPSLILIWSFVDPIQPKLFLEAPDDILSFAFSPTEPNIVAGGCINGQVVLWDIGEYEEHIKNPRGDHRDKGLFIPDFEDESFFQTPRIRFCALSALEYSHTQPITDIMWVPDHFEIDRMGFPVECKESTNHQLITAAIDNQILFWDTRSKSINQKKKDIELPMNVPQTFKHLSSWRPLLKVALPCSDPGGDFAPTKFSIYEKQGDKSAIDLEEKLDVETHGGDDGTKKGQFVAGLGKPSSGKSSRLLQHLNTRISIGTEDGQFVYVDWLPQKDADSSKLTSSKAEWYASLLDGPIVAMKRSPFFKDILLIAGGTGFNIWREKTFTGALLQTKSFGRRITDAEWSPSRPAVFFIAKSDGSVDIWDLLDRTHAPLLTQSISSHTLSHLNCRIVSNRQQLLAVGDSAGTLHIMDVPWSLRRNIAGEYQAVKQYLARETTRREYCKNRWDFREEEKRELERQAALKAGLGPPHVPTPEEITFKLKGEFNEYLQFEAAILRELGLRTDDDSNLVLVN